jgi:hypothetical protein
MSGRQLHSRSDRTLTVKLHRENEARENEAIAPQVGSSIMVLP